MDSQLEKANEVLGTNHQDWFAISSHEGLTEDFIRNFADNVYWTAISTHQRLSEDFIREFKDNLYWT